MARFAAAGDMPNATIDAGGIPAVTAPAWPRQYRIILRGECKQLLAGLLGDFSVQTGRGWTCVMASVRDESELYGLLERFQEFALHIVSLNELGAYC